MVKKVDIYKLNKILLKNYRIGKKFFQGNF